MLGRLCYKRLEGCDAVAHGSSDNTILGRRFEWDELPKVPFCTKNSTALGSVVFCYRRNFLLLSVPFSCIFCLEKQALRRTLSNVLLLL